MTESSKTKKELLREIEELQARLSEAEETLAAIQRGEVDAIIGSSPDGGRIYTLQGAEQPYRIFFEAMNEGAVTMDGRGTILYCNRAFADLAKVPLEKVTGMSFLDFVAEESRHTVATLLSDDGPANRAIETFLKTPSNANVPVNISMNRLKTKDLIAVCAIVTDLNDLVLMKKLEQSNKKLGDINEKLRASHEKLQASENTLRDSRRAALNLMEDAVEARKQAEAVNDEMHREVTERKRAEEALKKAHDELEMRVTDRTRELTIANESVRTERQRLFSVLETLPVYVILLTPDHHIPFANRFFRERFGDSNGRRCYEYLFNRTEPCETCETYTVLRTNAPHHWYWTGPDKRDYDIYDYPFVDSDGATMILEMGIDITDQKKAQQALRETITELQEATRRAELTTSLLTLITQKNTRREYLDATCDLLQSWSGLRHVGVRVTGPNRETPFESCKGYDAAFLEQENKLSLAEDQCICTRIIAGAPEPSDLRSMTPKGSFYSGDALAFVDFLSEDERSRYRGVCIKHRYRSLAVIPILYRGNPVGAVHLADERPEMLSRTTIEFLEQLAQIIGEAVYRFGVEEERMRLTSALESSADGVVITNSKNGKIEYVNRAFEQITGYAKNEAIGSNLHLLDSGKHDEAFYQELRTALARDGVWRGVLINRKKDGMLYYEECSFSPVREHDGSIVNYVSVKRDVTEKLRLESIAESVNSMNNIGYIFAGVRHEIGNPINSAKMMLNVLQLKLETATKESIKNYVDRSLVEIGRVENLLRNLKNFNLYETPELKDLHLPSFLREFRNLVSEDLKQKGIAFNQNIADGAERARIDPRALQQVLINLVTNATDAVAGRKDPSIEIHVRKEHGLLHIEVVDNGAGLTQQQQQDLFKPFYTSKQHGTGLGLVIVKKLLTRMNCGISVTSVPDEGTIVDITVPEGNA